jgi:hypothetical protein
MHVAVGEVSARRAAVCHGKEQARRSNWWIVERVKASALLESDLTVEQCNGTVQSEVGKVINFIDEHSLHIYSTCPRGSL